MVLFLGPFVLEEAALVAGAGLVAAGELSPELTLGTLYAGVVVSDWFLYGLGVLAARSRRIRRFVGDRNIASGREYLTGSTFYASLTARLVPWLLPPIFLASGYLRIGFGRFAAINACVAFVYVGVFFWMALRFESLLIEHLSQWSWPIGSIVLLVGLGVLRRSSKRRKQRDPGVSRL
ncbi:hypothetical protein [Jiella sp. M17.18]|uniref:hypothetical protein n=1 Tax=Jiella sp. M17.18 TaxID=3234247 RepID=UPI0034DF3505